MKAANELPKFIRTPLRSFKEMVGKTILSAQDVGNDKMLLVMVDSFILFESKEVEDEYGRTTSVCIEIIYKTDDVMFAVGLDKALTYGIIDGIAHKAWKQLREDEEEERLQRSLDTDFRKYQALQKAFEQIWDKQAGKWIKRDKQS